MHTYSASDGLGSNVVFGAAQDATGRMWFATSRGLVRYDGHEWVDFSQNPLSFEQGVSDVVADGRGAVWSVTFLPPVQVVCREPDGTVRELPLPATHRSVHEIQMLAVDRTEAHERVALSTVGREVLLWRDGAWSILTLADAYGYVNALLFHGDTLWVATEGGLLVWDGGDAPSPVAALAARPGPVYSLCKGDDGDPWVIGRDWIGRLHHDGLEIVGEGLDHDLVSTSHGIAACAGPADDIYYGDYRYCYHFHPRRSIERLGIRSGLIGAGATRIVRDREDLIWITCMRGVTKLISRRFTGYDLRHGLLEDEVTALLPLDDGRILLGHEGGLSLLGETVRTYPIAGGRGQSRVMAITRGPSGEIWIAGSRAGLGRWTEEDGVVWVDYPFDVMDNAYAVLFDQEGTLWVGAGKGLFRRDETGFVQAALVEPEPLVRRIVLAPDGSLLVCTGHHGVQHYGEGVSEQYLSSTSQAANSVYDAEVLPDGRIWVATAIGLYEVVDGGLLPVVAPGPEVTDAIYAIFVDPYDRVWFGTDSGVVYWRDGQLARFGEREGLIGSEVNRDALKADARGVIWIGTDRGVSAFDPQFDLHVDAPPLVEITGFDAGNGLEGFQPVQQLGVGPVTLEINFEGLSYVDEHGLRFSTWLEGFESGWSDFRTVPTRSVRYTNLMPGEYRFQVRAQREDGLIGETASTGTIVVGKPIWARLEVQVLLLALLLLFLWFGFSTVTGRRYTHRLESEVEQRTGQLVESERLMRLQSERLAATLGSISDGVLALDADGVVTVANPACGRILQCDPAELPGRRLEAVLPESFEPGREAALDGLFCLGRGDEPDRWLEVSSADLLGPEGRSEGSVLAFRDVTDRRRNEAERVRSQKLESLGVLAGGIAHDFNNLLTVILGNASLCAEAAAPDTADREALEHVLRAGRRARTLTEQLLTFARGGAPRRQALGLEDVVAEAMSLALSGTNVAGEMDLPADLPPVLADPGQIGQVVSNLLINACQAMPDGGRIRVSAESVAAGNGLRIRLMVEDDGPGVPEALLDQIFEPYFTTKQSGTGLGLAIAYSIAARHEGSLSCEVHSGAGARFVLELPAAVASAVESPPPPNPDTGFPARVLVLDDEEPIRRLIQRLLERRGCQVTLTAEGNATVAEYRRALEAGCRFDVVVLDLTVPGGLGGLEAFREIRGLDPDVVGVVVSGYSHDAVMADPRRFGFAAALGKPFDPAALEIALSEAVRGRPLRTDPVA